jgi:ABC-type transport system involved in multi-copper enzyme maturation permease subunit
MGMGNSALQWLSTAVGPLFTKELLVTSRRAKYYMLRFAYAAVLGLFVSLVWLAFIESAPGADPTYRIAHMSEMGKGIVSSIMCFQFGIAQFVAIILLSSSINEEIYQRTLVPILTTPIGYWQIVLGKFLGKLLHVGLLLAISLPLLGIVRVLGGVPWGYLLAGVCITVTASMFTGSVALLFSAINRRPYLAILASLGMVASFYVVVGLVLLMVSGIASEILGKNGFCLVLYGNPVAAMTYETMYLLNPVYKVPGFLWPIHCLITLAMTTGVLKIAEIVVRRSALRKAVGVQTAVADVSSMVVRAANAAPVLMPADGSPVARVLEPPHYGRHEEDAPHRRRWWKARGWNIQRMIGNSPIVWRELRKPLLRDRIVQIVAMCAVVFYLMYTYAILGASGAMRHGETQAFFVCMFLLAGMLCTALDSATCIAPEKQARTWPALLCTPVSDWHILLGKAGGTAFRCLSVWIFLAAHVVLFTLLGLLHPIALIHVGLLAAWSGVFLTCTGVYFSTKYRSVTTALLMNLGLAGLLWVLIPVGANLLGDVFGGREIPRNILAANPVVQAWVVVDGATRVRVAPDDTDDGKPSNGILNRYEDGSLRYDWPRTHYGWLGTTAIMLANTLGYGLVALWLAWRTKKMFRRNVFDN